jgi:hypothetical protein
MRVPRFLAAALAAAVVSPAFAQDAFDACTVFTQQDAEKALGTAVTGETPNPKAKKPKVVTTCSYSGVREGKPVAATAEFKVARNNEESQRAFENARLREQTKPMLLPGAEAFWNGKAGVFHLRKGRTWVTMTAGATKLADRDLNDARKLAEILAAKL